MQAQNEQYKFVLSRIVDRHRSEIQELCERQDDLVDTRTRELERRLHVERERARALDEQNYILKQQVDKFKYYLEEKGPILKQIQAQLNDKDSDLATQYRKTREENVELQHEVQRLQMENRELAMDKKRIVNESGKFRI